MSDDKKIRMAAPENKVDEMDEFRKKVELRDWFVLPPLKRVGCYLCLQFQESPALVCRFWLKKNPNHYCALCVSCYNTIYNAHVLEHQCNSLCNCKEESFKNELD